VLARLEQPQVIALDAVDERLDPRETRELWSVLEAIAEDGIAVLVTAREIDPSRVSTLIQLGTPQPPTEPAPAADDARQEEKS
jgi:ABC-2 type transport system ATP-binding protein